MKAIFVLATVAAFVASAAAQGRAPQPGPELKQLERFVGDSYSEGTMTAGQTSGKFTARDHAAWMGGGFFVENRSEFTTPFGPGTLTEILGYDVNKKVYTHDSYSSAGFHISSTGTFDGTTWVWIGIDGHSRHTIRTLSPSTSSFKTELSQDGHTWVTLSEGTTTRGT
jgi:hypothetical protein